MEIINSYSYPKQLIGGYLNEKGLITGQWGSEVILKNGNGIEKKINTFCTGLLKIHANKYLCLTSKNTLLQIDSEGQVEQIDSQKSQYFVTAFYMKTCLFMHNTIQQQRYLTLWNMLTLQKQQYQHLSNITSVMGADAGIWIGDQEGFLNLVSYRLKLMKRIKVFESEISQILVIQQRIYCVSGNTLKVVNQDIIISVSNFDNEISCLGAIGNRILLGMTNGELLIQENSKKYSKHQVHTNTITSISIYENQLVTTSSDRTAKIIKLK